MENVYEEVVSGDSLFVRPAMLALLRDVEAGLFQAVLCMDIDRLGRGAMQEQGLILDTLKLAGTLIVTPCKSYDLNNEMDETYGEFQAFMARQELKLIKGRLRRGVARSLEEGAYLSNPPFGYMAEKRGRRPTLTPHPEEAKLVQLMFELYAAGYGCQSISDIMSNMGAHPRRAEKFPRSTIRRLLSNPVYIGKVVWNRYRCVRPSQPGQRHTRIKNPPEKWMVSQGLHEPIVDTALFDRVAALQKQNTHPPYREPHTIQNPLAGLLYCQACGRSLQRRPFGNRPYQTAHLLCPTRGCVASARLDLVEDALLEVLQKRLSAPIDQDRSSDRTAPVYESYILSRMQKELVRIQNQEERLYSLLEQNVYSVELFSLRREALHEKKSALRRALDDAEAHLAIRETQTPTPKIENILQAYPLATPAQRNYLLKQIVARVTYYKPKSHKKNVKFILCIEIFNF